MAQLSIALGFFVAAVICVYLVERFWFHQRCRRSASNAISAAGVFEGGLIMVSILLIALIVFFVPLAAVHLVQRVLLGRQGAGAMQPGVFLRKACLALTPGAPSM
jgi:hypothetical protein